MKTLSIRVPDELEDRLDREASAEGKRRSEVVRDALDRYLEESEKRRFMEELVEDARRLRGDEESRRIAEEFLPLENEALEIAEGLAGQNEDEERWWD